MRAARVTKDEAEKAGVETRKSYFRVEAGKESMSPPADEGELASA